MSTLERTRCEEAREAIAAMLERVPPGTSAPDLIWALRVRSGLSSPYEPTERERRSEMAHRRWADRKIEEEAESLVGSLADDLPPDETKRLMVTARHWARFMLCYNDRTSVASAIPDLLFELVPPDAVLARIDEQTRLMARLRAAAEQALQGEKNSTTSFPCNDDPRGD